MFASLGQGVKQHLEGGRVTEACEDLHGSGLRKETFASVHSLGGRGKRLRHEALGPQPTTVVKLHKANDITMEQLVGLGYHGLGSYKSSQHASSRRTRGTEGHPDVCSAKYPAVSESLHLLCHLCRGKLQHRKPPETSILSLSQLWKGRRQK